MVEEEKVHEEEAEREKSPPRPQSPIVPQSPPPMAENPDIQEEQKVPTPVAEEPKCQDPVPNTGVDAPLGTTTDQEQRWKDAHGMLANLKDESLAAERAVTVYQKANQELEITSKKQQEKNQRLVMVNVDLTRKCQDVEDQAMRADDALVKLRKDLHEVLEEKESLLEAVAEGKKDSESLKADLEVSQEEMGLLKEQIDLKDRTIQCLRAGQGKVTRGASAQETEAFQKEIRDLQMQLKLEKRQRKQIAESSMLAEEKLELKIQQLEADKALMTQQLSEFQDVLIENTETHITEISENKKIIESLQKQLATEPEILEEPVATDGIDLDVAGQIHIDIDLSAGTSQVQEEAGIRMKLKFKDKWNRHSMSPPKRQCSGNRW